MTRVGHGGEEPKTRASKRKLLITNGGVVRTFRDGKNLSTNYDKMGDKKSGVTKQKKETISLPPVRQSNLTCCVAGRGWRSDNLNISKYVRERAGRGLP